MAVSTEAVDRGRTTSLWNDPNARAIFWQVLVIALFIAAVSYFVVNTQANLEKRGIASGLEFLTLPAGFDIAMSIIGYDLNTATHGDVLINGIVNTLLIAILSIVTATFLGFIVGIFRLSHNFLINRIAYVFVETLRNIPLLLQLLFWYFAVIGTLPSVRQALSLGEGFFITQRGVFVPRPVPQAGFNITLIALLIGIIATVVVARWAKKRQDATGEQFPVFWTGVGLVIGLPLIVFLITGSPLAWDLPALKGFNFQGGLPIIPELLALWLGLTLYTATFIGEIVRAGIQAVSHGQTEASFALGLRPGTTLRLVVIPQALRVIVPPLTSQYLNITKNSSLAIAIGYPEIVSVFAGTSLNQTGQAVECIAITMAFYCTVSLLISLYMNWYNRRIALVER